MHIIKAFHIMAMVAWFSGLFYLPRLFVYHAEAKDRISLERFCLMEKRLFYGITWPSAILTTLLGLWLFSYHFSYYIKAPWMHLKLSLVLLLWIYHLSCGHYLSRFSLGKNVKSALFFRLFNELPTLFLISIIFLVVVKPSFG